MEPGKDKVKKICDAIRKETLDPALEEARGVVEEGKRRADEILEEARAEAERIRLEARREMQREKEIFEVGLRHACKLTLEELKQKVEKHFFHKDLSELVQKEMGDTKIIAQLLNAVVKAVETEGMEVNMEAYVAKTVDPKAIAKLLAKEVIDKLKGKEPKESQIQGGVVVRVPDQRLSIDVSDVVLKALVAGFIRKDFRALVFAE